MKQIKRQAAAIAIALMAATLSSCSDKENDFVDAEAQDFSEEQIEKVAYGCGTYADWDEEGEKVETSATDEYVAMLKERLEAERNAGGNKSVALEQMVGVVKDKTCGKYDEVRIYYDSEDKKTNYRASHGYRGDWVSYHNLTMYFCLVPARLFHSTKDNYGVMNFSNDPYFVGDPKRDRVALIDGYMDAEDSRNESAIYYTKHGEKEIRDRYNYYTGKTALSGNGNLAYQMFVLTAQPGNYGYPDLGFDYGVFGMFNFKEDWDENQGKVHSDDEDSHNANSTIVKFKGEERKLDGSYLGVITVVENTDFFIAKIKTKK